MTVLVLTNINLILYYICVDGTACLVFFACYFGGWAPDNFFHAVSCGELENKEMLKGQNSLTDGDIQITSQMNRVNLVNVTTFF